MGGEAAKERRRLKRLQETDGAATAPTSPSSARIENQSNQLKVKEDRSISSGTDAARIRLQRKLARKASGKFKPHTQTESSSPIPNSSLRRELEDVEDNFRQAKRPHMRNSTVIPKGRTSRLSSPNNRKQIPHRNEKQPIKKEKKPTDKKKPKHLKRKMEQLSKTVAEGSSISDLDSKMKILQAQLDEYKRLKQRSETGDDVVVSVSGGVTEVNVDTMGMSNENLGHVTEQIKDGKYINEQESIAEQTQPKGKGKKKRSSEPSAGDSSDEEDVIDSFNTRSRGKRRRGRRESASKEEVKDGSNSSTKSESNISFSESIQVHHDKAFTEKSDTSLVVVEEEKDSSPTTKKTPKKDDKRRCIGRKPLTDFVVGHSYTGTVKYIKPKLGAFIDIGSHSDAFCHISCISDEFVSSVTDVLKVDDIVQNARVLEVDREKKRITVSLRSEEMRENELERLKLRRQYEKNDAKKYDRQSSGEGPSKRRPAKKDSDATNVTSSTDEQMKEENYPGDQKTKAVYGLSEGHGQLQGLGSDTSSAYRNAGVDLKRERKLARRAERRAAAEVANGNASQ